MHQLSPGWQQRIVEGWMETQKNVLLFVSDFTILAVKCWNKRQPPPKTPETKTNVCKTASVRTKRAWGHPPKNRRELFHQLKKVYPLSSNRNCNNCPFASYFRWGNRSSKRSETIMWKVCCWGFSIFLHISTPSKCFRINVMAVNQEHKRKGMSDYVRCKGNRRGAEG